MEFRALRYFVAVAEARSFTEAAKVLHVSQPALSQSIRRLERTLGSELFVRNRQNPAAGLHMTEAGHALLVEAKAILAAVERAQRRVQRLAAGSGRFTVHLGFASSTPHDLIASAMSLSTVLPLIDTLPVHVTWGDEHDYLRNGNVDLVFLQYPEGAAPDEYVVQTLSEVHRVLIIPARHDLASKKSVTTADLAGQPILDPGFADVPEMHRDFWLGRPRTREDAPRVVPLEVRTVEEMCACVAAGKGLAITSAVIARAYARPDLAFLRIEDLAPVSVGIARLASEHRPPVLQAFDAIAGAAQLAARLP